MLKRLIVTAAILAGLLLPAYGAGLYPLSRQQQVDSNSRVLSGAKLYLFDGGTSTPRTGYRDLALSSAHPNPIVADSAGRLPLIYLADGYYRHRLTTSSGTLVFDDDGLPVLSTSAGGAGTSVNPDALFKTRDVKIRFDDQPISGYVRMNGRTIGSASSGATERANSDTQSLFEELWGFANISVVTGKGASAAADFAANKQLTLPNAAGRGLFGPDDMGAGAQNVLTSTTCTNPTLIGTTCGTQTVTIAQGNIPSYSLTGGSGSVSGTTGIESNNHTHTFSGTTANPNVDHTHQITTNFLFRNTAAGGDFQSLSNSGGSQNLGTTNGASANHTHTFSGSTGSQDPNHTHNFTGTASSITISSGGSGTALNKLPPIITFMLYVRL